MNVGLPVSRQRGRACLKVDDNETVGMRFLYIAYRKVTNNLLRYTKLTSQAGKSTECFAERTGI